MVGAALLAGWAGGGAVALAGGRATTEAQNHQAAIRDARELLNRLHLPSGTTASATEPSGDARRLAGSPAVPGTPKVVDRHRWWTTSGSPEAVLSYVQAHPPAGGSFHMSGSTGQCRPGASGPGACSVTSEFIGAWFPARPGSLGTRWLLVEVARLADGSTGIRADAEVQWIVPRSPREVVPSGVASVHIVRQAPGQPPSVSRTVTNPSDIRKIVDLVDELPTLQPGVWSCPAIPANPDMVTITFQDRSGAALARTEVRADVGPSDTGCDAMSFWIGHRRQTSLVRARHFLRAVGRLVGARLTDPVR